MMGNYHARCGAGEKPEVETSEAYLSLFGVVPDFKRRLATARSRGIGMSILYQNIPQLQNRYPDGQWEEILGGCDISLFLGCNDMTTASYFSSRSGEVTVGVSSLRKNLNTMRMSDYVSEYSETSSVGKRMLLLPDEVLRFPLDQALVIIRGQKVLKVLKFDYSRHPEAEKLVVEKTEQHIPEWRRKENADCRNPDYGVEWEEEDEMKSETESQDCEPPVKKSSGNIEKVEDLFTDEW